MRCAAMKSGTLDGSLRVASSATTRQPPAVSVENTSCIPTSNASDVRCSVRGAGALRAICQPTTLLSPRCGMTIPFGVPVDPDVKRM
jgi:hypothetical protein